MTYTISKKIRILHNEDDWDYTFTADEYGTVSITCTAITGKTTTIYVPKDCIQNFINSMEEFK